MQRVGAVIVTYNNASMLKNLLEDLLNQTRRPDEIIVIDNASSDSTESMIKGLFLSVHYVRLDENMGSAGGYYEGIKLACENNDLVWTLDDDVFVDKNALETLMKWLDILEKSEQIGVVRSWITESPSFSIPKRIKSFAWRGTLIKKEVIESLGLPRKEYFMYADDVEYSFRIVKNGYAMFWIPESHVIEKRKDDKIRLKLFRNETIAYADKFRLYYAFRNQINLHLNYHNWADLIVSLAYAIKVIILLTLIRRLNCINEIKAVAKGVWDGLRGKLGKNQKYLPM